MKKLFAIFAILFCGIAHSAQIVNVEYIHNAIQQKWDITVPYNSELTNPRVAANMKYLLTAVDVANEMLNGDKTTDYGNGEYATLVAADTVATDTAVESLVKKQQAMGELIMTFGQASYYTGGKVQFNIAAAGDFTIDWGDGTTETIKKTDTSISEFVHVFPDPDAQYVVRLRGLATAYDAKENTFNLIRPIQVGDDAFHLKKLDGCLGCIFPTLTDGSQPLFAMAFLSQGYVEGGIPAGFLAGIHGTPRESMFAVMFQGSGFTSIGAPLFDDISGGLTNGVFRAMFYFSSSLTGESAKMKMADGTLKFLYEVYPDATASQVEGCYQGASGLDDYANMPKDWTYWDI